MILPKSSNLLMQENLMATAKNSEEDREISQQ